MGWLKRSARRVRVRSIILSGHRKPFDRWRDWLRWEILKAALPLVPLLVIQLMVTDLPTLVWMVTIAAFLLYGVFILLNAAGAAFTLNNRRNAALIKAGYDLSRASLTDPALWRRARSAGTMRDVLERQTPKPPRGS